MERNDPQRNQCKNLYADKIRLKWSSAIQFHSIPFSYFFSFYHFPLYHHYHHYSTAHSTPVWGKHLRYIITTETYAFRMIFSLSLSLFLFLSLFVSLLVLIPPISFSFYRSIDLSIYLSISYLPFKEYSTCEYILSVCIEKDLSTVSYYYNRLLLCVIMYRKIHSEKWFLLTG